MPENITNANQHEEQEKNLTLVRISVEESENDLTDVRKWPTAILMGD
jgi:hypothetical protein